MGGSAFLLDYAAEKSMMVAALRKEGDIMKRELRAIAIILLSGILISSLSAKPVNAALNMLQESVMEVIND